MDYNDFYNESGHIDVEHKYGASIYQGCNSRDYDNYNYSSHRPTYPTYPIYQAGPTGPTDPMIAIGATRDTAPTGYPSAFNFVDGYNNGLLGAFHTPNNYLVGVDTFANVTGPIASGVNSFANGRNTMASGLSGVAEGFETTASSGYSSYVEGNLDETSAHASHAGGLNNTANIGNGTAETGSNAFRVKFNGDVQSVLSVTGTDYAEMFQWQDGNPNNEDRIGYFVTLDGEYVRKANDIDQYILGVVSARSDHTNQPRIERKEWAAVGMLGKLRVRDDGSCQPNGFCQPNANGIATSSGQGYRVLKRLDAETVLICIKG